MSVPIHQEQHLSLTHRLKAGELSAFKEVYENCWKDFYIHAYKRIQSPEQAEELIQDLFVELWEKREQLTIEKSIQAYLYGVLRKKILLYFRKQYANRYHQEELLKTEVLTDTTLERRIVQRNLIEKIDQLILNLPEKTRHVFELSRKHFLSNRAIASKLDISDKTVEYHISYALKFLREHCPEYATVQVLFVILFQ